MSTKAAKKPPTRKKTDADRRRLNRIQRRKAEELREVGKLPKIANPSRRRSCQFNLLKFLITYFPGSTGLNPFSDDHVKMIESMQRVILEGGRRINAIYRGAAKTTISEKAALWATLYGHRKYVFVIGADQDSASEVLKSIKSEIETNELLAADFPEVCYPITALEGITNRTAGQTQNGVRTRITWGADFVQFPTIKRPNGNYSPATAAVIRAKGITGSLRGKREMLPDGTGQRPDLVIMDDIQTDAIALNPMSVRKIIKIIEKSVLMLAGHTEPIAAIMNATVIEEDDVVDTLLDHQRHPEWTGVRIPLVKSWASEEAHHNLWLGKYARIRNTYDNDDPADRDRAIAEATEFYRKNRKQMDAGCVVSWKYLHTPKELSAIQHAYNALIDFGPEVFNSEYQNNPKRSDAEGERMLKPAEFREKKSVFDRLVIPPESTRIIFAADVQQSLLFYSIVAVTDGMTGFVVDYGTFPEQSRSYFLLKDARRTIQREFPGLSLEKQVEKALQALIDDKMSKVYRRSDGVEVGVDIGLIDGGYMTDQVRSAIATSDYRRRIFPSFGRGIKASETPMLEYRATKGERRSRDVGVPWRLLPGQRREGLHVMFDTNALKTFVHRRIATPAGNAGSFTLYNAANNHHEMYADQVCGSEYPGPPVRARGRTVYEWKQLPSRPDNHFLDTLTIATVGASMLGSNLSGLRPPARRRRRKRDKVKYL